MCWYQNMLTTGHSIVRARFFIAIAALICIARRWRTGEAKPKRDISGRWPAMIGAGGRPQTASIPVWALVLPPSLATFNVPPLTALNET